jgi:hypothetical protein
MANQGTIGLVRAGRLPGRPIVLKCLILSAVEADRGDQESPTPSIKSSRSFLIAAAARSTERNGYGQADGQAVAMTPSAGYSVCWTRSSSAPALHAVECGIHAARGRMPYDPS